jgi:TetR/AcrR family transcriptional repressor of nem operon
MGVQTHLPHRRHEASFFVRSRMARLRLQTFGSNYDVRDSFSDRVRRFERELPPFEALEAFFSEIIERSITDKERKGCMLVNSARELAPHDKELPRVVVGVLGEVEAFFRRCVEAGQSSGTVTTAQTDEHLARLLLSVLLGTRVLARSRPKRELLEGAGRPVFALLAAKG